MYDPENYLLQPHFWPLSLLLHEQERKIREIKEEESSLVNLKNGDMGGFEPGFWETNMFWFLGVGPYLVAAMTSPHFSYLLLPQDTHSLIFLWLQL